MRMLFCSLLAAVALHQSVALADCASSPKPATQAFYSWYLQTFSEDKDPLTDNLPQMKQYVSESLIAKIKTQMASPDGLEEDYFIKAQDYMEEWLTQIKVSDPQVQGSTAKEQVTLGNTPDTTQVVDVRMIKDKGCWKIDQVTSTADQSD
ncbi:DUF3828 domain-containing protein [Pseudomonas sp. Fl5BN2]|uniref:DUF3828 domain-containing protein n=1 Tax=unclassified Pseudomonas TaxID=196821 RepID=UPI00137728A9|nr:MULTISPECIES: DUF3828 domain-containing protein [unclassified Pseudomonas]NBF03296.1 DUF3828 domain-containing protein [Pseudomonas sp. Fl5BN2]NBF09319.1 DUF3828 domain-containing protein [Pseudomonas sp. Fl4BN1]